MKHFEKELHQAQGSVDLLCAKSIKNKIKEGDNFAIGLWARNKFGWDRPDRQMTFTLPGSSLSWSRRRSGMVENAMLPCEQGGQIRGNETERMRRRADSALRPPLEFLRDAGDTA